ncbi:metal ABC transporter solute-binding protein, Zn/Mn family [Kaarinaea lacus]
MSAVSLSRCYQFTTVAGLLLIVLILLPVIGFAKPVVTVGVSIVPQKYFVERIAGDKARVIVMVGPGHNPATYEPRPQQLVQIEQARLYFQIGVPFETRWIKTFRQINPGLTLVPLPASITLRSMNRDAVDASDNSAHEHAHSHSVLQDPHVWLNPRLVKHIAESIKTELVKIDGENRKYYEESYRKFIGQLDELDQYIHQQFAGIKNRKFMVYHPSWGYFADEYGLQQIPIEVEGKQPGAKSLSRLIEQAQQNRVKIIFVQQQFSDRDAQTIAEQVGARVLVVDPLAENYVENLKRVSRLFAEALQ